MNIFRKTISIIIAVCFLSTTIIPSQALAQGVFSLPIPGSVVPLSSGFLPVMLKGLKVYPDNPFKFDFIIDSGDSGLAGDELKSESEKLARYFLATLTTPEEDLWVNLSPYEEDRIIPDALGETQMGQELLAQDYILKQVTASLMLPDSETGKEFWAQVYKKAYEEYGTTNIPVDTFNKVWIVPENAVVYEDTDKAFVTESHLQVMLEEDFVALTHASETLSVKRETQNSSQDTLHSSQNKLASNIVRSVLIPLLEKEVNEGKNFAQLRQMFHAMVLATWYKQALKESILNKVYVDQKKIGGLDKEDRREKIEDRKDTKTQEHKDTRNAVNLNNPSSVSSLTSNLQPLASNVELIYQQYLAAYKKGVCNTLKVEYDIYARKHIPRKYFSGGFGNPGGAVISSSIVKKSLKTLKTIASVFTLGTLVLVGVALTSLETQGQNVDSLTIRKDQVSQKDSIMIDNAEYEKYLELATKDPRTTLKHSDRYINQPWGGEILEKAARQADPWSALEFADRYVNQPYAKLIIQKAGLVDPNTTIKFQGHFRDQPYAKGLRNQIWLLRGPEMDVWKLPMTVENSDHYMNSAMSDYRGGLRNRSLFEKAYGHLWATPEFFDVLLYRSMIEHFPRDFRKVVMGVIQSFYKDFQLQMQGLNLSHEHKVSLLVSSIRLCDSLNLDYKNPVLFKKAVDFQLDVSNLVKENIIFGPDTKVIIISGYDEFFDRRKKVDDFNIDDMKEMALAGGVKSQNIRLLKSEKNSVKKMLDEIKRLADGQSVVFYFGHGGEDGLRHIKRKRRFRNLFDLFKRRNIKLKKIGQAIIKSDNVSGISFLNYGCNSYVFNVDLNYYIVRRTGKNLGFTNSSANKGKSSLGSYIDPENGEILVPDFLRSILQHLRQRGETGGPVRVKDLMEGEHQGVFLNQDPSFFYNIKNIKPDVLDMLIEKHFKGLGIDKEKIPSMLEFGDNFISPDLLDPANNYANLFFDRISDSVFHPQTQLLIKSIVQGKVTGIKHNGNVTALPTQTPEQKHLAWEVIKNSLGAGQKIEVVVDSGEGREPEIISLSAALPVILPSDSTMAASAMISSGVQTSSANRRSASDEVGGIDLNAKNLELKRTGSSPIQFNLPPEWQGVDLENIPGFIPVIINIIPIANIYTFLGLAEKNIGTEEDVAFAGQLVAIKENS